MLDAQGFQRCAQAFANRDYAGSAQQALGLMPSGATHELLQVLLISLQRSGQMDLLHHLTPKVLEATAGYPWEDLLLRLTLGRAKPADAAEAAQDDVQRCQAHYYTYWRLLSLQQPEAARRQLDACLAKRADCLEHQLAEIEQRFCRLAPVGSGSSKYHEQVAQLNGRVMQLSQQGRYQEAMVLVVQARDLAQEHLGDDHPEFATSLHNLAALYQSRGDYAAAEPLYQQALDICRKALGEDHPEFAMSLNNLAELYREMGDYGAAEPLYRQAMRIQREALGDDHPEFARIVNNLALLYRQTGN